jgi:signal transduction histidine kinase
LDKSDNKWLFKFHQFRHKENDKNSIDDNQVNAIFQDDHCLWIGTQKGLNVQNLKTKKWEHYEYDENDNKSLGAKAVCAIFRDSRNNMWIGTWAGGLNLFNETTKTFTRFLHDPNDASSISGNNIFNIKEDEEGIIWIAVLGRGLNSYDYKTNSFKSYINDPVLAKLQYRYAAVISVMDENDEILIAASGGFEILNKENEEVLHFKNNPADPKSLSSDGLTYVFKDSKRNIWLGTNNGLNLFNRDSLNFKLYNKKDGLPNNVIQAICEDDHGNLWISTNKGMSKFISGIHCPEPPVFENFDIEDGLQGNVFNARSCFKSTDGILYFGGPNGFNVFQPDSIKKNPYIPNVVFTNLLIFNKPVKIGEEGSPLTKHISLTKELTLKHNQSVITIEYSTFDYLAPDKIQYAFMMEGFEKEWNYVGNQKFATYTNLDPGEYTFHVKASNSDGFWDAEKKSIKIIITPPFWQTWIFRSIVILFMLIAIYIVDRIRIRNMELQRKKLQIQVNDKTSELSKKKEEAEKFNQRLKQEISEHKKTEVKLAQANQELYKIASHDLQEPLRTIASYVQLLKLQKKGKIDQGTDAYIKFAVEGVERMKQIILDITMYSRLETHGHSFRPTSCEEIFTQLLRNLRDTTHKNGIKITHDTLPMVKADQNQLKMVFHNLIDNAIKFKNGSETTEIHVSADKKESHWIFTIKDNGIGIDPNYHDQIFVLFQRLHAINEYKGTGIGLAVCKKIVERHGGEIWVESEGKGKGSTFYFTIPVTHS